MLPQPLGNVPVAMVQSKKDRTPTFDTNMWQRQHRTVRGPLQECPIYLGQGTGWCRQGSNGGYGIGPVFQ